MRRYYLAYGSNLNLRQMRERCKYVKEIGTTVLENYRLVYKGSNDGNAYLTIEQSEGDYVPVGIFQISVLDEKSLDRYEGYPYLYHKNFFPLEIEFGKNGRTKTVNALIYVMNEENDYHVPSCEYMKACLDGYDDFGFDKKLLDRALDYSAQHRPRVLKK